MKFVSYSIGNVVAVYDQRSLPLPTIRHENCDLLLPSVDGKERCKPCDDYRCMHILIGLHCFMCHFL